MKIVVLVKQVPDTWGDRSLDLGSGRLDRRADPIIDEITERAIEVALQVKDGDPLTDVTVLTMGPDKAREALRKGLSMGADRAVHVLDDELVGADLAWTALVLAAAIRRIAPDLVIAGNESTDGRGGVLPAMLAEHLGLPLLDGLDALVLDRGVARGNRPGNDGFAQVHAQLPAVVSVLERIAEPRFSSFKGILSAKKKPMQKWTTQDLDTPRPTAVSLVVSAAQRPPREAGRKIIDDGTASGMLADFLLDRHLA